MKSKYLLLFAIALILLISTFILAQGKKKGKYPQGKVNHAKEKLSKSATPAERLFNLHIKKGQFIYPDIIYYYS